MSHGCVLVIGELVEQQLAPYSENLEVEPYKKYESAAPTDWPRSFIAKEDPTVDLADNVAVARWLTNRWGGEERYLVDDEGVYQMSTYNPQSKWDYWRIGGRWAGRLLLKSAGSRPKPELSWEWEEASPEERERLSDGLHVDQATKGEIDWHGMALERLALLASRWDGYEGVLAERGPEAARQAAWLDFGLESDELEMGRDDHLARVAGLTPLYWAQSIVAEGVWREKGRLGWFGMSTDGPEEREQWDAWISRFIDKMPDDVLLTICDYHI